MVLPVVMSTRRSQADSSGPRFQMTQTKPPAEPRKAPRVADAMRARCHEQSAKAKSLPGTMAIHSHQITTSSKQKRPSRRQGEGAMEPCEQVANAWRRRVCMRFRSSSRLGLRAWRSSIGQQQPRPAAESPGCDATTQEEREAANGGREPTGSGSPGPNGGVGWAFKDPRHARSLKPIFMR